MTFWQHLDTLVASHELVIDRPRGSAHPRYPDLIYPLDYGYLAGTRAADGAGIDVWVGSLPAGGVTAVLCTVDALKGDAELKLLLRCTAAEAQMLAAFHTSGDQTALLVVR
jgi:inorganic pyrophosphatase